MTSVNIRVMTSLTFYEGQYIERVLLHLYDAMVELFINISAMTLHTVLKTPSIKLDNNLLRKFKTFQQHLTHTYLHPHSFAMWLNRLMKRLQK